DLRITERRLTRVAHRRFVSPVPRAARLADAHGLRRELHVGCGARLMVQGQHRAHDAIRPPLVVDEAAWPKLGEREETWALEISLPAAPVVRSRDVGHER